MTDVCGVTHHLNSDKMAANGSAMSANNAEGSSIKEQAPSMRVKCSCTSVQSRTIFILTLVNFLAMTAYAPIETLQSSLNSKAGLGAFSLACLYVPYFIFSMFAPTIVRVITPKWCLVTAWSLDALYIGANFYPTWLTLVPTSAMTGAMVGPLWTAKDLYVLQMARQSVKPNIERYEGKYQSVLSFYNGIVFAGLSFSLVVGQIISSSILLQSPSSKNVSVCGAFNCRDDVFRDLNVTKQTYSVSTRPDKSLVYILLGILLSLILLAILLVIVFLQPIPSENQNHSITWTLLSCGRRTTDPKMLLMVPQVVMFGFYQAMVTADYTKSYITCAAGVGMVGYVMLCHGVTSTLASVVCGRLVKYTGRQIQVIFSLLGYTGLTVMLWVWIPSPDDLALFLIVPAVFGISDVVFLTNICTILAVMFKDDSAAAFSNLYTFRALSKAVSFVLSGFVCVWVKLTIASILLTSACVAFLILELKLKFQKPLVKDVVAMEVMLDSTTKKDVSEKTA